MASALLEARQITKTFRKQRGFFSSQDSEVRALCKTSFSLLPGETAGLVGESGSGKTTLARILIGLLRADSGEVFLDGTLLVPGAMPLSQRRRLQYIFQNPLNSLNPRMSVEETLREPLTIHNMAVSGSISNRINQLLEAVQLPAAFRTRMPRQLSGGERQRVGIARALALKPEVLICDEPIASLDISVGVKILELLRRINQQEKTALLFISHDLRAVAMLCSRVMVMQEGSIIEAGLTGDVLKRPKEPYTRRLLDSALLKLDAQA